jgi:MoaA/NifB/PqqE/SkfB family radical SAM enzyme
MGFKKILILLSNTTAFIFRKTPAEHPSVMMIDPANVCNLRCSGCATALGYHRLPPGVMDLEGFKNLIDEIKRSVFLVALYNSGEPFCHPHIFEMLAYLNANKIAVITSTNGHFFETDEKAEQLVKSSVYMVIISLSGATQEVYEKYHQKGDLNMVIENIKRITRAKKKLRKKTPILKLRFLIFEHNQHEKQAMEELGKRIGGDMIEFRYSRTRYLDKNSDARDLSHPEKQSVSPVGKNKVCPWPWLLTSIHWDGTTLPCCFFALDLPVMGNALGNNGFKRIWRGRMYEEFRNKMKRGKNNIPACRCCYAQMGFQEKFRKEDRVIYIHRINGSKRETRR